jgi:hypothetical protein
MKLFHYSWGSDDSAVQFFELAISEAFHTTFKTDGTVVGPSPRSSKSDRLKLLKLYLVEPIFCVALMVQS